MDMETEMLIDRIMRRMKEDLKERLREIEDPLGRKAFVDALRDMAKTLNVAKHLKARSQHEGTGHTH